MGKDSFSTVTRKMDLLTSHKDREWVTDISFKMSSFNSRISELFDFIHTNPSRLEEVHPGMITKLTQEAGGTGQGLASKLPPHEAAFAVVLEEHGWRSVNDEPTGFFYKHQANGTQQSIDFRLMEKVGGVVVRSIDTDLKHGGTGSGASIFLNDGKFLDNVIYVISFTRLLDKIKGNRKCPREHVCVIALGQDVMTDKDKAQLDRRFALLKQLNAEAEDTDDLVLYIRSANQFKCRRFTPEFIKDRLEKTLAWLGPSPSPSEPALRSPPA